MVFKTKSIDDITNSALNNTSKNTNYALFAGGYVDGVDAYDASLTKTIASNLQTRRGGLGGATISNYALFAGGAKANFTSIVQATGQYEDNPPTTYNLVDSYDTSLTKGTATNLDGIRRDPTGINNANYALFAGGNSWITGRNKSGTAWIITSSTKVTAYNQSLTKTSATDLTNASSNMGAAYVGNYALLGSGTKYSKSTSSPYSIVTGLKNVNAYDSSLTKTTPVDLSDVVYKGTNLGNYAIFLSDDAVDFYNTSLTKTTGPGTGWGTIRYAINFKNKYALFIGYLDSNTLTCKYDTSLTRTKWSVDNADNVSGSSAVCENVGDYVLIKEDTKMRALYEWPFGLRIMNKIFIPIFY